MRFSLRNLLLGIGLCALALGYFTIVHQHWVIPNTPLNWRDCTPADLGNFRDDQNYLVIVAGDWTFTGSFGDVRSRLETEKLRKLVARESIQTWYCDITTEPNISTFFDIAGRLNIEHKMQAPFVLLKRGKQWVACPIHDDTIDFADTKQLIETAFGTRPSDPVDLVALAHSLKNQQRDWRPEQPTGEKGNIESGLDPKLQANLYLDEESRQGVLEVNLELVKGEYIYGLNEAKGGIGVPCSIRLDDRRKKIAPPQGLELLGPWTPDPPAMPVKILGERHFVHEGTVAWRSRIAISKDNDPTNWNFKVFIRGQICTETTCRPILQDVPVSFAGPITKEEIEKLPLSSSQLP